MPGAGAPSRVAPSSTTGGTILAEAHVEKAVAAVGHEGAGAERKVAVAAEIVTALRLAGARWQPWQDLPLTNEVKAEARWLTDRVELRTGRRQ